MKQVCCCCKIEKEEKEFTFKNKKKNVRNKTCKSCFKETRRKWYDKYKEKIIEKNIKNKEKNLLWFNEYRKELKCVRCGENHPACLEFHHKDPKKKEYTVSRLIHGTYSIKTILNEIEKCEVLCVNCHRRLHYEMHP